MKIVLNVLIAVIGVIRVWANITGGKVGKLVLGVVIENGFMNRVVKGDIY